MVPSISRRRALRASCVAGLAALAGCLGDDDDDSNGEDIELPNGTNGNGNGNGGEVGTADVRPYREFVAGDEAGEVTAIYADLVAMESVQAGFEEDLIGDTEDPLLLIPALGVQTVLRLSVTLEAVGLGPLLDRDGGEFESELEALAVAGQAFIAAGTIEPDEVDDVLREDTEDGLGPFEPVDDIGEFTLYQLEAGDAENTLAVSSTEIISAGTRPPVERAVEAAEGDRQRATEEFAPFEWVLDAVDEHHIALAGHGELPTDPDEQPAFESLADSVSFAATHRFGTDDVTAEAAAVFESAAALDDVSDGIEASFGSEGEDVALEFDDDRFSVTGTYQPGVIEE